ncbi:hypothetical protein [Undibacterium fentianense]|uniref:Uncharacterized protein n=1 Tax=Undibacterium fentianense TaxID=2828728 RepID=A0A941E813_9BURK|nr:hypothetical protein [Undibacterium fentianense]MBR7800378.1 hypothetical protein [Undibacterium fentianense]
MRLPEGFEIRTQLETLQRPHAQFQDRHFEQASSRFAVRNVAISPARSERHAQQISQSGSNSLQLQNTDRITRLLWDDLLGIQATKRQRYQETIEREFRFQVMPALDMKDKKDTKDTKSISDIVEIQCQAGQYEAIDHLERSAPDGKGKERNSHTTKRQRLDSHLRCELDLDHTTWHLSVDREGEQALQIQLRSAHVVGAQVDFRIQQERASEFLLNGEWRDAPFPFSAAAGLLFFQGDALVAALSFDGRAPKIWLDQKIETRTKQLLFAASYSLLMYDWLDPTWREAL